MNRTLYFALLVVTAITITSCASTVVELKLADPKGKHVYKITAIGVSHDIRDDAIDNGEEFCKRQNKHFKFVKNIFLPKTVAGVPMVTLDLFFTCLDEPPEEPIPPDVTDAKEEEPARKQEAVQEKPVAKPEPESSHAKEKKIERTGDSPGEMESLGDQPDSSGQEMKPAKQDDTIIEEILDK